MSTLANQRLLYAKLPVALPSSHMAVPITPEQVGVPVRVCVVVRRGAASGGGGAGAAGGALEPIRETLDARVVLGALVDSDSRVLRWLEVWLQQTDGPGLRVSTAQESLSNSVLDERWSARCDLYDRLAPEGVVRTGFEREHPPSTLIDLKRGTCEPATLTGQPGRGLVLCQDEVVLKRGGLAPFGASMHRYVYSGASEGPFVAVTGDAPMSTATKTIGDGLGLSADRIGLNASAGLMMVTSHYPVGYEQYVDALAQAADGRVGEGPLAALGNASEGGGGVGAGGGGGALTFVSRRGPLSRLSEVFFLRVKMLHEAVWWVRSLVAQTQEPLLNITARSFRVAVGGGAALGTGAPLSWASRVVLSDPGVAVTLPVATTNQRLFVALGKSEQPIYGATSSAQGVSGVGSLRIRQVLADGVQTVLEATLTSQERIAGGSRDFVWLRFGLGAGRVDAFGMVDKKRSVAGGEVAFRTVPQRLEASVVEELKANAGVTIHDVTFQLAQLLSTPGDLYSLAVLGARTLLVNEAQALPVALDELRSLAQDVANEHDAGVALHERVARALAANADRASALGPQRLSAGAIDAPSALRGVPMALWSRALAVLVRMMPGAGPDSVCRDLGDAPSAAVEKVFDPTLDELARVLDSARSALVSDPGADAELRALVGRRLK